jgi:transposase
MARAYEDDLRRKIFEAHANGHGSFRKLAGVFGVSLGYVEKIFRQRRQSGQMERVRYRPGPKSRVSAVVAERIVHLVKVYPDLTVAELRERIAADTGVEMSWSLVRLWLGRLGLRLKKVAPRHRAGQRSEPQAASRVPRKGPHHLAGEVDLSGRKRRYDLDDTALRPLCRRRAHPRSHAGRSLEDSDHSERYEYARHDRHHDH